MKHKFDVNGVSGIQTWWNASKNLAIPLFSKKVQCIMLY